MTAGSPVDYFEPSGGPRLAFRRRSGRSPTLIFLPGYASDMDGAKAQALDGLAERQGLAMVRFDYSGTGSSAGRFEDGTLEQWLAESLLVVDRLTDGPVILVGSSMGGWIAYHVALARPQRVQAVVGIAAAPDFTDWGFSWSDKRALLADGRIARSSAHGDAQLTTLGFWQSGERLRLLGDTIAIDCPVRLIHGTADSDVPLQVANRTLALLRSGDVQLVAIKGGGHRLSESHEIEAILRTVAGLTEPAP